ncbi:MAG: hypothetical protein R2861_14490 [Desulfobacterales bacterium]
MGSLKGNWLYLKRAPEALYEKWKKPVSGPETLTGKFVEIMHCTHIGVDMDYKNLMQGVRASIADGWGGSMPSPTFRTFCSAPRIPAVRSQPRHESRPRQR